MQAIFKWCWYLNTFKLGDNVLYGISIFFFFPFSTLKMNIDSFLNCSAFLFCFFAFFSYIFWWRWISTNLSLFSMIFHVFLDQYWQSLQTFEEYYFVVAHHSISGQRIFQTFPNGRTEEISIERKKWLHCVGHSRRFFRSSGVIFSSFELNHNLTCQSSWVEPSIMRRVPASRGTLTYSEYS